MGVALVCEVLDCPIDLTTSQRLVLVALAERANDQTREVWTRREEPVRDMLKRRTGLTDSGLTRALQGISKLVGDVRVPLRTSPTGQPVYAYRGSHATTFRLPPLPLTGTAERVDESPPFRGKGGRESEIARTTVHPSEAERVDESPPLSLSPYGIPHQDDDEHRRQHDQAVALVWQRLPDVDRADIAAAVAEVQAQKAPDSLAGYMSRFGVEDIRLWSTKALKRRTRALGERQARDEYEAIKCEHGVPHGMRREGTKNQGYERRCDECERTCPADATAAVPDDVVVDPVPGRPGQGREAASA